jgi:integrase
VLGKGNKERIVPLPKEAAYALLRWIAIRGIATGPLFLRIERNGKPSERRLTEAGLYAVLQSLTKRAQIAPWTPHDARRTYAGDLFDAGVDIRTVQELLGHRSPVTSAGYDRRGERAKRDAADRLSFPIAGVAAVPSNDVSK